MRKIFISVLMGAALAALPAVAHHSFAAEYDGQKPVTLQGTLTKIDWTNPHSWIYVDVKGDNGKVSNWAIEFGAPGALLRRGLRKSDFPLGAELVVKGFLAKNGTQMVNGTSAKLPDGRNFFTGASNSDGVPKQ